MDGSGRAAWSGRQAWRGAELRVAALSHRGGSSRADDDQLCSREGRNGKAVTARAASSPIREWRTLDWTDASCRRCATHRRTRFVQAPSAASDEVQRRIASTANTHCNPESHGICSQRLSTYAIPSRVVHVSPDRSQLKAIARNVLDRCGDRRAVEAEPSDDSQLHRSGVGCLPCEGGRAASGSARHRRFRLAEVNAWLEQRAA